MSQGHAVVASLGPSNRASMLYVSQYVTSTARLYAPSRITQSLCTARRATLSTCPEAEWLTATSSGGAGSGACDAQCAPGRRAGPHALPVPKFTVLY